MGGGFVFEKTLPPCLFAKSGSSFGKTGAESGRKGGFGMERVIPDSRQPFFSALPDVMTLFPLSWEVNS